MLTQYCFSVQIWQQKFPHPPPTTTQCMCVHGGRSCACRQKDINFYTFGSSKAIIKSACQLNFCAREKSLKILKMFTIWIHIDEIILSSGRKEKWVLLSGNPPAPSNWLRIIQPFMVIIFVCVCVCLKIHCIQSFFGLKDFSASAWKNCSL